MRFKLSVKRIFLGSILTGIVGIFIGIWIIGIAILGLVLLGANSSSKKLITPVKPTTYKSQSVDLETGSSLPPYINYDSQGNLVRLPEIPQGFEFQQPGRIDDLQKQLDTARSNRAILAKKLQGIYTEMYVLTLRIEETKRVRGNVATLEAELARLNTAKQQLIKITMEDEAEYENRKRAADEAIKAMQSK
jgi:hypothetical protein